MNKKSKKERNKITNKNNLEADVNNVFSKIKEENSDLGKIMEEAFYNALRRIEDETKLKEEHDNDKKQKDRLWVRLLLFIFFPFVLRNKNKNSYDVMMTMLISFVLEWLGLGVWFSGFFIPVYGISKFGLDNHFLIFIGVGIILIAFGSITLLAGKAFSEEKDSAKIHAFSASVFALISCIIAIIALVK